METIGRLARRFGLSRSTLLYYDSLGLVRPSERTPSNYRRYSAADVARLEQVMRYRAAGVPLADVQRILDGPGAAPAAILERRLEALNAEIAALRQQQEVIVRILRRPSLRRRSRAIGKAQWVALLRAAGLDEAGMCAWHSEFERVAPAAHQDFLESLGLRPAEVSRIRRLAAGEPRRTRSGAARRP
jgi:DNA-binding transcriptional MerR regulator